MHSKEAYIAMYELVAIIIHTYDTDLMQCHSCKYQVVHMRVWCGTHESIECEQ